MNNKRTYSSGFLTWIWIARISSLISIGILLLFLFGGNKSNQFGGAAEVVGFLFFPIGISIGMLVGWCQNLIGGLITALSLVGFYIWHFVVAGSLPSGIWFAVFASPGILFLSVAIGAYLRTDASNFDGNKKAPKRS